MESSDCGYKFSYENGYSEIPVCDEIISTMKSESFKVDMERFTHLSNKEQTYNSRFNLPRSLSKKGEEKKTMSDQRVDKERDVIFSLKGSTGIMSDTPIPASMGTIVDPQTHHQISIGASVTAGTPTKSKLNAKRSASFKHTSIINPTRILFFFATLSSIGTVLLIYFTLSMAKYKGNKS